MKINIEQMESRIEEITDFNTTAFTQAERDSEAYVEHCKAMIKEEAETEREEATSAVEELDSLCDTIVVCTQAVKCVGMTADEKLDCYSLIGEARMIAHRKGYDLNKALQVVNNNNMTKFPLLAEVKELYGEEWEVAACDWIVSQGRYTEVYSRVVTDEHGTKFVVFKCGLKVVKWAGYVDVNIEEYV